MRDAESMLDQLLSSAPETIDEARVRDLLGLADAEAVDAFVAALVAGDAAAGIALLDALEERGRDARILLDQTIEAIRARLVETLSTAGDGSMTPGLADAARRLAAIDPDRAGVGGLRLQLELALFATPTATASTGGARPAAAVAGPWRRRRPDARRGPAEAPATGRLADADAARPTRGCARRTRGCADDPGCPRSAAAAAASARPTRSPDAPAASRRPAARGQPRRPSPPAAGRVRTAGRDPRRRRRRRCVADAAGRRPRPAAGPLVRDRRLGRPRDHRPSSTSAGRWRSTATS